MSVIRGNRTWTSIVLALFVGWSGTLLGQETAANAPVAEGGSAAAASSVAVAGSETSAPVPAVAVNPVEEAARLGRLALTQKKAEIEKGLQDLAALRTETEQRISALTDEVASGAAGSAQADDLDRRLIEELQLARRRLRHALAGWRSPSEVEKFVLEDERTGLGRIAASPTEELQKLQGELDLLFGEATDLEREARWEEIDLWGFALESLTPLRVRSMEMTSLDRRNDIFGVGREGLEQLGREIDHFVLAFRLYFVVRRHDFGLVPALLQNPFEIGAWIFILVRVVVVLLAFVFLGRRWRDWLESARQPLMRSVRSVASKRRLERALGVTEIALPWLLVILAVAGWRWALAGTVAASWLEVEIILTLLLYYAAYRLSIDLVVAMLERIASHYEMQTKGRHTLLARSVRAFFRVAFALVVITYLSGMVFGGGYLNHLAIRFASVVLFLTFLVLLLRWRKIIADAFLRRNPQGKIADLVLSTRDNWYGVFVAPASFLWLAGRGVTALARDFAMGFEQTRRALAFLFRRKIEKQAERKGYADGDVGSFPASVLEAFREEPVNHGPDSVALFPDLDLLHHDLSRWNDTSSGGSLLITGERGIGKTSWLNQIQRGDVDVQRVELGRRVVDVESLGRILTLRIARDEGLDGTIDGLARHLNTAERRLIVLDMGQHLFLATVGGYAAWSAFTELVDRTRHQVFWICSMSRYAWLQLRSVQTDWAVFSRRIELKPWTEEQIRTLLSARMKASECKFDFASLALDRIEGVSSRSHLVESIEGYTRLLWDYSDGNPRVAIHFFLRSLDVQSESRMRVRLFRAPDVALLGEGGDAGLFILASIVTHESISYEDVVTVMRYPENLCRIHLDRFMDVGVIYEDEGLYRLTTHWQRAAIRTLRRKNVIAP